MTHPMNDKAVEETNFTDAQIKYMSGRFLWWKLPEDFRPDGNISFEPTVNKATKYERKAEPVGTNLFTATQAEAMVRFMIKELPLAAPVDEVMMLEARNQQLEFELTNARAEAERFAKLISDPPLPVIEPKIEALLLGLETPTREDVANGTTVVYTPKPDVLWLCFAYRRLRAVTLLAPVDEVMKLMPEIMKNLDTLSRLAVTYRRDAVEDVAVDLLTRLRSLTKEPTP